MPIKKPERDPDTDDMFDPDEEVVLEPFEVPTERQPPIGHNNPPPAHDADVNKADAKAREMLHAFRARIEALEEERKDLAASVKHVYAEAKAAGFDVKALRAAIKASSADKAERTEFEDLRDFYLEILEERI